MPKKVQREGLYTEGMTFDVEVKRDCVQKVRIPVRPKRQLEDAG